MGNKIKIGVIGAKGFPAWGGAARANEAIFTRLKGDFDITAYAVSSHATEKQYDGINQIIFSSHKNRKFSTFLYYLRSLFHALFYSSYKVVHVNHLAAGFLIPFLRLRYQVVLNVHGMEISGDNKWNKFDRIILAFFQKIGLSFASVVVTVEKGSVVKLKEKTKKKVIYIPNGIDNKKISDFSNYAPKSYDITFSAARIIYLKGLHLLIDALQKIRFDGNLQIIGDLDQVESYKKAIMEKSAGLNCDFVGLVKNRNELFLKISNSKLFVFPSYSEGMSNMLLEAASLKVPIIASDIPQNTDVFTEDEVLFFNLPDIDDLAEKIAFALKNEDEMEIRAQKAFNHLQTQYDWDKIAIQYKQVYLSLCKR